MTRHAAVPRQRTMTMRNDRRRSGEVDTGTHVPVTEAVAVSPSDVRRRFQLSVADEVYALHDGMNVIGRDPESDVVLDAAGVSRRHACITVDVRGVFVEDLGSRNGTFIGSRRITTSVQLKGVTPIRLGPVWLVFHPTCVAEE